MIFLDVLSSRVQVSEILESAMTSDYKQSHRHFFDWSHTGSKKVLIRCAYRGTLVPMTDDTNLLVERVQTGVRIEKRILKVLKAFAEYHDMTLGDVLEGIVLHAFDGKTPFSPASLDRIRELKKFYELDLDSSASHRLKEIKAKSPRKRVTEK